MITLKCHMSEKIIVPKRNLEEGVMAPSWIVHSWERVIEHRSKRWARPGHEEMEEIPPIWQEVCPQKLGG